LIAEVLDPTKDDAQKEMLTKDIAKLVLDTETISDSFWLACFVGDPRASMLKFNS
jgi:hypothetical protein